MGTGRATVNYFGRHFIFSKKSKENWKKKKKRRVEWRNATGNGAEEPRNFSHFPTGVEIISESKKDFMWKSLYIWLLCVKTFDFSLASGKRVALPWKVRVGRRRMAGGGRRFGWIGIGGTADEWQEEGGAWWRRVEKGFHQGRTKVWRPRTTGRSAGQVVTVDTSVGGAHRCVLFSTFPSLFLLFFVSARVWPYASSIRIGSTDFTSCFIGWVLINVSSTVNEFLR